MTNRKGEKIGWIGGWLGGFIWLVVLSAVWFFQNKMNDGITGMVLFAIAIIVIIASAPWKYPNTQYWKLMLPIYFLFFISIGVCVSLYGGLANIGLNWTAFFWLIPCLIPFITDGRRTWNRSA